MPRLGRECPVGAIYAPNDGHDPTAKLRIYSYDLTNSIFLEPCMPILIYMRLHEFGKVKQFTHFLLPYVILRSRFVILGPLITSSYPSVSQGLYILVPPEDHLCKPERIHIIIVTPLQTHIFQVIFLSK